MLHGGFVRRALAVFAQAPRYDADAAMNAVEHAGDQEQANKKKDEMHGVRSLIRDVSERRHCAVMGYLDRFQAPTEPAPAASTFRTGGFPRLPGV